MRTTWCTSSHHKMAVSTLLLVVSLVSLIYADTYELKFDCTAAHNAKRITDNSTSGSLLSPCYPQSYTSTSCTIHNQNCYIVLPIRQEDTWIGFYNGDSESSLYPGDYLGIGNLTDPYLANEDINIKFQDLSSDEFIHRFSYRTQPTVLFQHPNLSGTDTEEHRFRLIYRSANIIPTYPNIVSGANSEGFIVSHRNFNHGRLEENSYFAGTTSGWFKLTGISPGSIVKLTFIYFKINYTLGLVLSCSDYLTINGIKGYRNYNVIFCGYDEPTSIDLYPVDSEISFQFITKERMSSSDSTSAGFLIQYQVLQETCPQTVEHATVVLAVSGGGRSLLTITCDTGYMTIANSTVQVYLCNNQESVWPCLAVECDDLEDLLKVPYLNISLNSAGKLVSGSVITFSCNSSDYVLDGDNVTTCSTNGVWDLQNMPNCVRPPIAARTTTNRPIITKTLTANGPVAGNVELDNKTKTKNPSIPVYAGIGGGAFAFLVLVVAIIVILVKKGQISRGEQFRKRPTGGSAVGHSAEINILDTNIDMVHTADKITSSTVYTTTTVPTNDEQHSYVELGSVSRLPIKSPEEQTAPSAVYTTTVLSNDEDHTYAEPGTVSPLLSRYPEEQTHGEAAVNPVDEYDYATPSGFLTPPTPPSTIPPPIPPQNSRMYDTDAYLATNTPNIYAGDHTQHRDEDSPDTPNVYVDVCSTSNELSYLDEYELVQ